MRWLQHISCFSFSEVKVHIFWEGHKILQNLHLTFVLVSSILKMVGPKTQEFCPRINMLKGIFLKTILWWIMVHQKVLKLYFQSKFSMSKIDRIFSRKIILTISIYETIFCKKKQILLTPIFDPLYFLKSCPIFDKLSLPVF